MIWGSIRHTSTWDPLGRFRRPTHISVDFLLQRTRDSGLSDSISPLSSSQLYLSAEARLVGVNAAAPPLLLSTVRRLPLWCSAGHCSCPGFSSSFDTCCRCVDARRFYADHGQCELFCSFASGFHSDSTFGRMPPVSIGSCRNQEQE